MSHRVPYQRLENEPDANDQWVLFEKESVSIPPKQSTAANNRTFVKLFVSMLCVVLLPMVLYVCAPRVNHNAGASSRLRGNYSEIGRASLVTPLHGRVLSRKDGFRAIMLVISDHAAERTAGGRDAQVASGTTRWDGSRVRKKGGGESDAGGNDPSIIPPLLSHLYNSNHSARIPKRESGST